MDEAFLGDGSATNPTRASGSKRNAQDDGDYIFSSKKSRTEIEEAANAIILSLKESFQSCKDDLASCQNELESAKARIQNELESAKAEVHKWKSAFQKESFIPHGKSPEPGHLIDHIERLKSSEKSLKEELEIAQMKLAIRELKDELKLKAASMKAYCSPEADSEQGSAAAGLPRIEVGDCKDHEGNTCTSPRSTLALLQELRAAKELNVEMREVHTVEMAETTSHVKYCNQVLKLILEKYPTLLPPPPPSSATPPVADD